MKSNDEAVFSRRRFLRSLGASSSLVLAGCHTQDPGSGTTTTSSNPTETSRNTATTTDQATETPKQWEVDPLEQDKLVGAHYYPWYWGEDGYAQFKEQPWPDHSPYTPELGAYDSRDPEVVNQHIKWALENGVNWFVLNSGGPRGPIRNAIDESFLAAELSDHINFSFETGLDLGPVTDENGQYIVDHPDNLARYRWIFDSFTEYFEHPNYVRIDGRPILLDFGTPSLTGDIVEALDELRDSIDEEPYIVSNMPGFWNPPAGNPRNRVTRREVFEAYDAVRKYAPLPPTNHIEKNYPAYWGAQSKFWRFLSDHHETGFIPTVMPGMNDQEIDWADRVHHDIMDFTDGEFREICDQALNYVDPELDAVIITSWNEFPEGTTIEPAEEYGHHRLDIVRQELGEESLDPLPVDEYHLIELDFNQTISPGSGSDGRKLAFFLESVGLVNANGIVRSYDVGSVDAEPLLIEGAYNRGTHGEHTGRWLGGESERTVMYVHPDAEEANEVSLTGRPISPGEIAAEVSFKGNQTDRVELDGQGDAVYRASLVL